MLSRKDGAMGMAWDGTPSYLRLGTDELAARARQALALLGEERCRVCPQQSAQTSTYEPVGPDSGGASAADDLGGVQPRRRFSGR